MGRRSVCGRPAGLQEADLRDAFRRSKRRLRPLRFLFRRPEVAVRSSGRLARARRIAVARAILPAAGSQGGYGTAGGFSVGSRIHFLGVLFAGPVFHADGSVAVINIPTSAVAVARTDIPIHLGYYVKASQLLRLKASLFSAWNVR